MFKTGSYTELVTVFVLMEMMMVRQRVINARNTQLDRQGKSNRFLSNKEIEAYCKLSAPDEALLAQIIEKFRLSARAYHRILKVARTIADLAQSNEIQTAHLSEAVSYRAMDQAK